MIIINSVSLSFIQLDFSASVLYYEAIYCTHGFHSLLMAHPSGTHLLQGSNQSQQQWAQGGEGSPNFYGIFLSLAFGCFSLSGDLCKGNKNGLGKSTLGVSWEIICLLVGTSLFSLFMWERGDLETCVSLSFGSCGFFYFRKSHPSDTHHT